MIKAIQMTMAMVAVIGTAVPMMATAPLRQISVQNIALSTL